MDPLCTAWVAGSILVLECSTSTLPAARDLTKAPDIRCYNPEGKARYTLEFSGGVGCYGSGRIL